MIKTGVAIEAYITPSPEKRRYYSTPSITVSARTPMGTWPRDSLDLKPKALDTYDSSSDR